MKSYSIIFRRLVVTAKRRGKSFRLVAREFCLPIGTVKTWWHRRGSETPHCEEENGQHETTPRGAWMQSVYHDSAHFMLNGLAACASASNGVHNLGGVAWLKHDGNLRKCFRCLKHAPNVPDQATASGGR
jgi:hypothetical protein